jgi:hypothetical protein
MLMTVCKVAKHSRTLYCARAHVVCTQDTCGDMSHDTKKRGGTRHGLRRGLNFASSALGASLVFFDGNLFC